MARKGNQQMNGVDRHASSRKKKVADSGLGVPNTKGRGKSSEVKACLGEELPNGNHPSTPTDCAQTAHHGEDVNKINKDFNKAKTKEGPEMDKMQDSDESVSSRNNSVDCRSPLVDTPSIEEENGTQSGSDAGQKHMKSAWGYLLNGFHLRNMAENVEFSGNVMLKNLSASASSMLKVVGEWVERQKPSVVTLATKVYSGRDYAKRKMEQVYPVVLKWLTHLGNVMLILTMVWLDSTLRGIDSFLHLGITSFFSLMWCSIISIIAMIGMTKFLIVLAIAALVGVFLGLTVGLLVVAICGLVFLWSYGSFWTTAFVMVIGGLTFMFSRQRITLLIPTGYSVYCAWTYSGWLGLLLAFNLSFISSDILTYFVKNNIDQQSRSSTPFEQSEGIDGRAGFADGEPYPSPFSEAGGSGSAADRSSGIPSTSGTDSELTSEDEIVRLLNCNDHYSVWGMRRYENVDVSLLKREYRKKAMLVHPDKNMGNEKAAEAFKKLQNAYEILLDSTKQKAYDDELRRDDFLNYFRRFQTSSQQNGGRGFFGSGFTHSESDCEDPFGDSRRIACKKCGDFHLWVHTKKSKSRARWCQDCKDFHQAKDGDGWVEQSSQPFLFGLLQKVDPPSAYVCADSKIYKATEWYICQGMRCPANTHKPSFHVNTSVTSNKQSAGKASSSGQRSGRMPGSGPGTEESMSEEEFMEWLKNAVQAGVFDNFSGAAAAESPSARAGNGPKSSTSGSSNSSNKRKKKGKKQW